METDNSVVKGRGKVGGWGLCRGGHRGSGNRDIHNSVSDRIRWKRKRKKQWSKKKKKRIFSSSWKWIERKLFPHCGLMKLNGSFSPACTCSTHIELVLKHPRILSISMLGAGNMAWGEHLHYKNQQLLQIWPLSVPPHLQRASLSAYSYFLNSVFLNLRNA